MNLLILLEVLLPIILFQTVATAEQCIGKTALKCANCTHIKFCDPWLLETAYIDCSVLTKGKEVFCNAGDCSDKPMCNNKTAPGFESDQISSFKCAITGLLPDATNCRKYYNCPAAQAPAQKQLCPPQTQYNANTRTCEATAPCVTVDCDATERLIIGYDSNSPFYIYCDIDDNTGIKFPVVLRCPEDRMYDAIHQECVISELITPAPATTTPSPVLGPPTIDPTQPYPFFCNSNDLFPDPLNCTRFYACPGFSLRPISFVCPSQSRYNAATGQCEIGVACREIDCAAERTYVVGYGIDSPYYVLCDFEQGRYVPNIFRCSQSTIFDLESALCVNAPTPIPTTTTPAPALNFRCTSIGSFPDVSDCGKYHICKDTDIESVVQQCPENYFYSISTENCLRQIFIDQCVTINCSGNAPPLQVFGSYRRYYADCQSSPVEVYKCPNGWILNMITGECE